MTLTILRCILEVMLAGFDAAIAKGKELVADVWANETFHLFPRTLLRWLRLSRKQFREGQMNYYGIFNREL